MERFSKKFRLMTARLLLSLCLVLIGGSLKTAAATDESVPDAIFQYTNREEPAFAWKHLSTADHPAGKVHQLRVTSQTWQGMTWEHAVEVFEPVKLAHARHALLFVTGGSRIEAPSEKDLQFGFSLAAQCGGRVVVLHQVPNQPLLGNRKEDDLITETWLRYLNTGDATWPLLFPMVKSAVKTMDAVQEFCAKDSTGAVEKFVISGASKRGWTSWLTPVVDARIAGTAPIVIDVLNFREQMQHQLSNWGKFSEQIIDYTSKGLVKIPGETETEREAALRTMMDPYTYRRHLKIPKLLIVGTNDPYWVVDSMNLYWDDLVGPRYVKQVPNAGHGLDGGRDAALTTLAAFFRHISTNIPLPQLNWQYHLSDHDSTQQLTVTATECPEKVLLWTATSADSDFRDDKWISESVAGTENRFLIRRRIPSTGHTAMFAEVLFVTEELHWSLTTLVYKQ